MKFIQIVRYLKIKLFKEAKYTIIPLIISAVLIYSAGCGNNSVTNPTAANVTFQISQQNGQQGVQFLGKPSVDVKITRAIISLAAQNYFDTVNNASPNYVFSKDSSYVIGEFTGVLTGQKWAFNITGTTVSGGTAYTAASNYTVP